jgi:hypothetical protein
MGKRVAIVCVGKAGDVACCSSVLRYAEELWGPGPEITWHILRPFVDPVLHNPWTRVETHDLAPDEHYGWARWREHTMRVAQQCRASGDYDEVCCPAPYVNTRIHGDSRVRFKSGLARMQLVYFFGRDDGRPWRPVVHLTDAELGAARGFLRALPADRPRVMLETGVPGHQSDWDNELTLRLLAALDRFRPVVLCVTPSVAQRMHGRGHDECWDLGRTSFRQLTEVYNGCTLFLGCSSGAACVSCAWRCSEDVPRLEYMFARRWWEGTGPMRRTEMYHEREQFVARAVEVMEARC